VGTLPLDVKGFADALESGETTADFVEACLRTAQEDLDMFVHTPILQALKVTPDGVRAVKFVGVKHEGVRLVQPKQVAVAMKEQQAIIYHHPTREYRLATRAHRTALLERWKDVVVDALVM